MIQESGKVSTGAGMFRRHSLHATTNGQRPEGGWNIWIIIGEQKEKLSTVLRFDS
jgi:hypothetical protein